MKRGRINAQSIGDWFDRAPKWLLFCLAGIGFFGFLFGGGVATGGGLLWVPLFLFGMALSMTSVVSIFSRSAANSSPPDLELKYVWSVHTEGSVVTWRLKGIADLAKFRRQGRFVVALFVGLTVLACAGYGVIGWSVFFTKGGLRKSDLPSFIPVATVALLLLAVLLRIAWNGVHAHSAYEVQYDRVCDEIRSVGLQPLKGIVHRIIPIKDIVRVTCRRQTYKSVTLVRVIAFDNQGQRHLLFGGLNTDDWDRIGATLVPVLSHVGAH
jgi:hypothetical protein